MRSEAVLYTTIAVVHRHRHDLVSDSLAEPGAGTAVPAAVRRIQPPCVWQPISCGAWAQVHICAEIDRHTSDARFRIVVWILESGAVVVNDVLDIGCRWWQSTCDDRAFCRLTGVDGFTYGFQFRSATKAAECSRIVDHVLTNPGVLKVVRKLMRANVDLQGLVLAWQGISLHAIHNPTRTRIYSETRTLTPSSSPPSPSRSEPRSGRRTIYPKQHDEVSSPWSGDEQQQQAEDARALQVPTDRDSTTASFDEAKNPNAVLGPEDDSSLAGDEEDNQEADHSNEMPTSPVALLETGGAMDIETRFTCLKRRSQGQWISRPYKTRGEIHVTYDVAHARFEGLPDAWRTLNHQFGLPLDKVPRREVEGYETKVPAVLEMMKICFLAHDGARAEGVFRVAPDKTEYNAVKAAINDGSFEDCSDVHIMASLIKVWFRELPVGLFNMLPKQQIALACELVNPEPPAVLQSLSTLPSLHRSVVLWLLDLLNEVVKFKHENKMTAKSMAIVMAPNLVSVESSDIAVVVAAYRQVADFVQVLLHARLRQLSTV
ncbi:hypothetical protein PHYPSEUDO_000908 [Phytophthora pseudosyringae]|uniref:Rho-GAP domain-containing protein n=1 Tax=Phytophthora pseudosyringae TaxID=221518 RepID=A0A8T1VYD1_9STRA|nr:hypothetical protein PHYPSEUDO_000908 [Phytophthora pseudosyringae]